MKLPLSNEEYALLEKAAERHGLTVDEEAQLALLVYGREFFRAWLRLCFADA